jgi:UDP-N-acetylglucosamine acyltransferase
LKRRGFTVEEIAAVRQAYKTLYKSNLTLVEAKEALLKQVAEDSSASLKLLSDFLATVTRGIVR